MIITIWYQSIGGGFFCRDWMVVASRRSCWRDCFCVRGGSAGHQGLRLTLPLGQQWFGPVPTKDQQQTEVYWPLFDYAQCQLTSGRCSPSSESGLVGGISTGGIIIGLQRFGRVDCSVERNLGRAD